MEILAVLEWKITACYKNASVTGNWCHINMFQIHTWILAIRVYTCRWIFLLYFLFLLLFFVFCFAVLLLSFCRLLASFLWKGNHANMRKDFMEQITKKHFCHSFQHQSRHSHENSHSPLQSGVWVEKNRVWKKVHKGTSQTKFDRLLILPPTKYLPYWSNQTFKNLCYQL